MQSDFNLFINIEIQFLTFETAYFITFNAKLFKYNPLIRISFYMSEVE